MRLASARRPALRPTRAATEVTVSPGCTTQIVLTTTPGAGVGVVAGVVGGAGASVTGGAGATVVVGAAGAAVVAGAGAAVVGGAVSTTATGAIFVLLKGATAGAYAGRALAAGVTAAATAGALAAVVTGFRTGAGLGRGAGVIGAFVIVACAATLQGHPIQDAGDAAAALQPLAGSAASALFGVGLAGLGLMNRRRRAA